VDESEYLTPEQAAAYSSIPLSTFRRYLREGRIPFVRPGGRERSRIRIRRCDIDAFMSPEK
jgi:excisionase family DNA binding protein